MSSHLSPGLHFSPERNWMNDPNGLIFYKGKYHLFFQHNPFENIWGNMSWGHAVSEDLIKWNELPVAIACDDSHAIFSGSAVVDYFNTSGFGTLENPAMVAIYTAHKHDDSHQAQALAYSLDEGLTWVKYEGNPVLDLQLNHFRDPKVMWDRTTEAWLMTVVLPKERKVSFYSSKDLKNWAYLSDFGPVGATDGDWECPDLFPLFVDGDESRTKWVLLISINPGGLTGGSGTQYFIGDWNGKEFIADDVKTNWLDYGRDNYAGVTFNDVPNQRRVFIGWMSNWEYAHSFPTSPWRGAMTLPRELTLITKDGKISLAAKPVTELENYLGEKLTAGNKAELLQIMATISTSEGLSTKFRVTADAGSYFEFGYDAKSKSIFVDRSNAWNEIPSTHIHSARLTGDEKTFDICAIVGSASVEIFAAGGTLVITDLLFLSGVSRSVSFEIAEGCQPPRSIAVRAIAPRR
ncbi:fructan beta-fructosidase [Candidatus Planktophila lacus]|uniref:glycoside hydrolase family 32 protein n=1 Tax=Candidatus Planktophila lacus TaxID=1884913 RepID=UPI000BACA733|nr:glycoside hydrolase family 32 protein [Candidatus Planktophila lacus]ASY28437.1 fructan beta-fructosidase [Candidatus Planktophila lacus]